MAKLKALRDQVMVITGASSGIGLVTARMATSRGARVVLAARDEDALRRITDDLRAKGGEAAYVVCDVGRLEDVRRVAEEAVARFGRIDTWINNAGVSVYGRLQEVPLEDQRQVFETNFWGTVHGSYVALKHLEERGGALINVGSVLSERAIPLQGIYSASKHAVKGFTDSLRMEVEERGAPVSISLVKPAGIDTPYPQRAGNYMEEEPQNAPPLYAPETVARAILRCATHHVRHVEVGGTTRVLSTIAYWAPRVTDLALGTSLSKAQRSREPARGDHVGTLYAPHDDGRERGRDTPRPVFEHSLYTAASLHPVATTAVVVGAGALAFKALSVKSRLQRMIVKMAIAAVVRRFGSGR